MLEENKENNIDNFNFITSIIGQISIQLGKGLILDMKWQAISSGHKDFKSNRQEVIERGTYIPMKKFLYTWVLVIHWIIGTKLQAIICCFDDSLWISLLHRYLPPHI